MRGPDECSLCHGTDWRPSWEKAGRRYRRCGSCGFVVADISATEFARLNQETFEGLFEHYVTRSYQPRRLQRYHRRLARLEARVGVGRLLEVGANVGAFLFVARERGWRVEGVEPVDRCARFAREEKGLPVRSVTIEAAKLAPASFDAVYSHAVLEHLTAPLDALEAMTGALRPGGVLYLDTVNARSFTARRLGPAWKLIDPALHHCLWSPATLRIACARAGLEVLAVRTHGVRRRPSAEGRPRGWARVGDELAKLPWSVVARATGRGELVSILARRPREAAPTSVGVIPMTST
ncbi:MAG: class I SAM-dependent methyltransferase [Planctomycetota bacterium]|nr:class I SAM-dependent methyltransferase [Planctomycetota bacterium]